MLMNPTDIYGIIPAHVKADLQEALDNLAKGIRDPEKMKEACEEMDRLREENRRLFGETNIAVELIRQTRDQP
jgi:chromatin segregation and condensation protein Rec8/ScpA/Scc1 (kleisin family)